MSAIGNARLLIGLTLLALVGGVCAMVARAALPQQFGSVDLLTQANLQIDGGSTNDFAGISVAGAGDVNGDGIGDVIVGAFLADNNGRVDSGSAYVIFGQERPTRVDLADLGSRGFRIDGAAANDAAGASVAGVGDVNGDGLADVIVGARDAGNNARSGSGSAYVVFGKASSATVDLGALGAQGFRIDGAAPRDGAGASVAGVGDVNGDGRPDVAVGAQFADNNGRTNSGSAYVVFGKASTTTVDLNALAGQGFRVDGAAGGDEAGTVAGAGDVNGDGRPDVIVGAADAGNNARPLSGSAYVIFGKTSTTTIDLGALGAQGFRIDGAAAGDVAGYTVAGAGDVNGDGHPDVIVAAANATNNGRAFSGSVYVVFGKTSTATIDLGALGAQGFRVDGAAAGDEAGYSVAGAGDINGDGRPDVIVGAPFAGSNARANSGSAYEVYGFGTPSVSYPRAITSTVGQAIAPLAPIINRTGTASFAASPPLPAGLSLDPATGVVSGTPAQAEASTAHTVTMTDLAGVASTPLEVTVNAAGAGAVPPRGDRTPTISGFTISPRRFAVGRGATAVSARARQGALVRYILSETATATITIQRAAPGRRSGASCRPATRRLRRAKHCSLLITAGMLRRVNQRAGNHTLAFSGRIGVRPLNPARYRATILATDSAGNHSRPRTISFEIVRR